MALSKEDFLKEIKGMTVLELNDLLDDLLLLSVVLVRAHTSHAVDDEYVHPITTVGILEALEQITHLGVEVINK